MLVHPQSIQILNHIRKLILELLEAALQLEKLRPHLLGKIIDSLLRVLDSDRWQYDDLVELCHVKMHRHLAMILFPPQMVDFNSGSNFNGFITLLN